MTRSYALIGAPTSAGAYAPGQEKAPAAMRDAGLLSQLAARGNEAVDLGDTDRFRWTADRTSPTAMHADVIRRIAGQVQKLVLDAWEGEQIAIVVGGDCTTELGVVSAAGSRSGKFGLIYIDGDADMRTPEVTTDGAVDWMGVAHMLDLPGSVAELSCLGPRIPLLDPEQLLLFATWNTKPDERAHIERLDIAVVDLEEVAESPESAAQKALEWSRQYDTLLVHLDVDVLDYEDFPLAENTRRKEGLTLEQMLGALAPILGAPNLAAFTICEVNPDHGSADGSTIETFAQAIVNCLEADAPSEVNSARETIGL